VTNRLLLQLTNIINNETGYSNIYDYALKKTGGCGAQEFKAYLKFLTKDHMKFLIMPASYGARFIDFV